MGIKVTVEKNDFAVFSREVQSKLDMVLRKIAYDIERRAKALAPVDTGNLRSEIMVTPLEGARGIGYSVISFAEYSIFVEMGTAYQPAQPYLLPAANAFVAPLAQAVRAVMEL